MTTLKALETSLYWQRVVYRDSKDQAQRERVKARIAQLEKQIAAHPDKLEIAP